MIRFRTPVVVEPGVLGRFRIVVGPQDALDVLDGRWPDKASADYKLAIKACRQARRGRLPPADARRRFVAAAKAARVLVPPSVSRRYTVGNVDLAVAAEAKDDRQQKPPKRARRYKAAKEHPHIRRNHSDPI